MMEWYEIYRYRFYDINIYTKQIRSHKHYKADPFHYLQQRSGSVTITDDYGKSKRVKVEDLYIQTFNMGHKLHPVGHGNINAGGMSRINRKYDISMDFSKYVQTKNDEVQDILIKPFEIR